MGLHRFEQDYTDYLFILSILGFARYCKNWHCACTVNNGKQNQTNTMTIYGTKVAKLIVEPIEHKCANCGTVHTMDMHVFQKYRSILGVPFFPTNKTGVALCTHCMQALKRNQMPPELLSTFNKVKSHATIPMWTWAGVGVVLLLLVVLFSSFVEL
jgi:hypothetical protein